ncbi:hypothetical protein BBP40_001148 [Aspergillus hancockii]|nr:hypothetical protein BBP40_001148 [Aspergillus hancockii]
MSTSQIETDVILNRANVALARSQRLVASWLPPKTAEEQDNTKSGEIQREEDDFFTAVPETLGVGAPLPSKAADGSWNRTELGTNDKLRRQLLGRNYKKVMAEKNAAEGRQLGKVGGSSSGAGSAASRFQTTVTNGNDEEEEEGRTALVGKKRSNRKRKAEASPKVLEPVDHEHNEKGNRVDNDGNGDGEALVKKGKSSSRPSPRPEGRRKATSFLDEILAERSRKRKKN